MNDRKSFWMEECKNGMRYIRVAVILLFAVSLGVFGAGKIKKAAQRDPHVPVITADSDAIEVPVEYTREDLLQGMQAYDEEDGDLTSEIMTGEFSPFFAEGKCNLNYIVFDSANQPGVYRREITFTGYEPPRFTLSRPLVFRAGETETAYDRIGAQDMLDGDISDMVRLNADNVSYLVEGEGTVDVEVSNSLGDSSQLTLPVHVVPAEQAVLNISTPIVYVGTGGGFDLDTYKDGITSEDGEKPSPSEITAQTNVDTKEPGVYEVHFTYGDAETWMTVVVRG